MWQFLFFFYWTFYKCRPTNEKNLWTFWKNFLFFGRFREVYVWMTGWQTSIPILSWEKNWNWIKGHFVAGHFFMREGICIEGRHLHREKAFLLSDQNNLNILCSPPIFIMKSSSPGINSGRFEDVLLHVLHSWGASYFGGGIRVKFSYINFITGRRNGHIRIFTSSNRMQCAALLILLLPP